jgi:hypothetical protein
MIEALRTMREVGLDGKDRLALAFTAACGVAIGSGILASLIYLLLNISSMVRMLPAFSQSAPVGERVRLQSGRMSL